MFRFVLLAKDSPLVSSPGRALKMPTVTRLEDNTLNQVVASGFCLGFFVCLQGVEVGIWEVRLSCAKTQRFRKLCLRKRWKNSGRDGNLDAVEKNSRLHYWY